MGQPGLLLPYLRRLGVVGSATIAGKAHPHLAGADLVLTYATNTLRTEEYVTDTLIYYPRFVRLTRCG